MEERLNALENTQPQRRGPERQRGPQIDLKYVNGLEARLNDLEKRNNSYRQEQQSRRPPVDERSARNVGARVNDVERGRGPPVDQRSSNEIERRRNENMKRTANSESYNRKFSQGEELEPRQSDSKGYPPVDPNRYTQPERRDGFSSVNERRNNKGGNRPDELERQRTGPPAQPRPDTIYEEHLNVRLEGLENMPRENMPRPGEERNVLATPTNTDSYTNADSYEQKVESLALTNEKQVAGVPGEKQEVITYDDYSVADRPSLSQQIFDRKGPTKIQGGALKTFVTSPNVNAVHIVMRSEGHPIDADLQLWHGPDNTPYKMRVFIENGLERHFSAMVGTPRGPNTVAIRNTGHIEFPFDSCVVADTVDIIGGSPIPKESEAKYEPKTIQGGALHTYNFDQNIEAVQVLIKTDGRPLNARIELVQGPENLKQTVEVFSDDGIDRPFFIVIESPGSGNTVKVVNTSDLEYPIFSWVEPYSITHSDNDYYDGNRMLGDDNKQYVSGRAWNRGFVI